jgi:hypothetical protein
MHLPINVKSPDNINKWQMGFNSAFKGLIVHLLVVIKVKVKVTLVQALRICTGRTAHRGSRGIHV